MKQRLPQNRRACSDAEVDSLAKPFHKTLEGLAHLDALERTVVMFSELSNDLESRSSHEAECVRLVLEKNMIDSAIGYMLDCCARERLRLHLDVYQVPHLDVSALVKRIDPRKLPAPSAPRYHDNIPPELRERLGYEPSGVKLSDFAKRNLRAANEIRARFAPKPTAADLEHEKPSNVVCMFSALKRQLERRAMSKGDDS